MLCFTTQLISHMDPIKYIFEKPTLTRKISRWQSYLDSILCLQCKGRQRLSHSRSAIQWSRFLRIPLPRWGCLAIELEPRNVEPWCWKLYFDGATNSIENGVGVVLSMARDGHVLCTYMTMFSQSDHLIGLKFYQHQYVTIPFNSNDQDLNMNFIKSSGIGTIY